MTMGTTGPDEIDGFLADDLQALVKAELERGERLLWAARPLDRRDRISGTFVAWTVIAAVLLVVGVINGAGIVRNPLGEIGSLTGLGCCLGIFGVFVVVVLILSRSLKRAERGRLANTLYALTDRRAIIWTPVPASRAVKIVTVPRGLASGVHRVEYPDGSGDVLFQARAPNFQYGDEYCGPSGFLSVADVRRVDEQVRRTLLVNVTDTGIADRRVTGEAD